MTANSPPNLPSLRTWFSTAVTLDGSPYTLDDDQLQAVLDDHFNTLVTARAGSGKTRVIVAKIAYLVAKRSIPLEHLTAFMFNRTAAAEVNQRLSSLRIDGQSLLEINRQLTGSSAKTSEIHVASTFHKFALDIVKLSGARPQIISETEQSRLISESLSRALTSLGIERISPMRRTEYLRYATSFIARAGQNFSGPDGFKQLEAAIKAYCAEHSGDTSYREQVKLHRLCLATYRHYLAALEQRPETMDFNQLLSLAVAKIRSGSPRLEQKLRPLRYLLVDEYQDFSYLFFTLLTSVRSVASGAHLFAVGDDWQAINRFAGSDVDYFLNFAVHFPEDTQHLPLATNYRSARRIVAHANRYMLRRYDPHALPARAFQRARGSIHTVKLRKLRFSRADYQEDALGDGRYLAALLHELQWQPRDKALKDLEPAARLLKASYKIIKHHRHESIMLLHRHNFTTVGGVTLEVFHSALQHLLIDEHIMSKEACARQLRCMTMHKSKGLEADVVILLELDRDLVLNQHPDAELFTIFGDSRAIEQQDQHRLLYVALTRAKRHLYLLTSDKSSPLK